MLIWGRRCNTPLGKERNDNIVGKTKYSEKKKGKKPRDCKFEGYYIECQMKHILGILLHLKTYWQ